MRAYGKPEPEKQTLAARGDSCGNSVEERVGAPELLSVLKCLTGQFTDQRENMFDFKGKMLGYKERQYRKWKGKEGKRNKIQKGN